MFNNKNNYNEAPYAAGMNFDLEEVEPFLKHLSSSVLESYYIFVKNQKWLCYHY